MLVTRSPSSTVGAAGTCLHKKPLLYNRPNRTRRRKHADREFVGRRPWSPPSERQRKSATAMSATGRRPRRPPSSYVETNDQGLDQTLSHSSNTNSNTRAPATVNTTAHTA